MVANGLSNKMAIVEWNGTDSYNQKKKIPIRCSKMEHWILVANQISFPGITGYVFLLTHLGILFVSAIEYWIFTDDEHQNE